MTESPQPAAGRPSGASRSSGSSATGHRLSVSILSILERSGPELSQQTRPGVAHAGAAGGSPPGESGPRPCIARGRLLHVSTPGINVSKARAVYVASFESVPRGARAVSRKLSPPLDFTAPRLGSRRPSQYPEAHRPSVPRARCVATTASGPSRAERPATQPAGPLQPALGQATSTAPQGSPVYRTRPRPAPPPQELRHWPTQAGGRESKRA